MNTLNYKPENGFLNTTQILNQIRKETIAIIKRTEGTTHIPSLCPINFFIFNPEKKYFHNITELTYDELFLSPDLNNLLHNICDSLHGMNKEIDNKIEYLRSDNLWGEWRRFNKEECLNNFGNTNLQNKFDDITKDCENELIKLVEFLEYFKTFRGCVDSIKNQIEISLSIIKARIARHEAFKRLVAELLQIDKKQKERIEEGIISHPKFSSTTSTEIKLSNWIELNRLIKKFKSKSDSVDAFELLNRIILTFLDLAQEFETSKAINEIKKTTILEYATRNDKLYIGTEDLFLFKNNYDPWASEINSNSQSNFPLYRILQFFEKIFYGLKEEKNGDVDYIVYIPIRTFPCSGMIIGHVVSIHVNPPNLKAIIDAYKLYEQRISQALLLDFYNSVTDQVISSESCELAILGDSLLRLLPLTACFLYGEKLEFAYISESRNINGVIDTKNFKHKSIKNKTYDDKLILSNIPIFGNQGLNAISNISTGDIGEEIIKSFNLNSQEIEMIKNFNGIYWELLNQKELHERYKLNLNKLNNENSTIIGLNIIIGRNILNDPKYLPDNTKKFNYNLLFIFEEQINEQHSPISKIKFEEFIKPASSELSLIITNILSMIIAKKGQIQVKIDMKVKMQQIERIEQSIKKMISVIKLIKTKSVDNELIQIAKKFESCVLVNGILQVKNESSFELTEKIEGICENFVILFKKNDEKSLAHLKVLRTLNSIENAINAILETYNNISK